MHSLLLVANPQPRRQDSGFLGSSGITEIAKTYEYVSDDTVWAVAQHVGLSPSLINKPDQPVGPHGHRLKLGDRLLVCVIR